MSLKSINSGETNVIIYLLSDPSIYDVFRVRVATMVQPSSNVQLHVGSSINFKLIDYQNQLSDSLPQSHGASWSSSNLSVIEINPNNGEAQTRNEGQAVVKYSNGIVAETSIHVTKVHRVELAQGNLMLNVDSPKDKIRVRLKMFLRDH